MCVNPRDIYVDKLANAFREDFEQKTGKTIGTGVDFDMSEVISFYGGTIDYIDLYDFYKVDSVICKYDKGFKIIVDKNKSEQLKKKENEKIQYGKWNLFIMHLFYHVISRCDKISTMNDGDIIYPSEKNIDGVLLLKKVFNETEDNKLEKRLIKK